MKYLIAALCAVLMLGTPSISAQSKTDNPFTGMGVRLIGPAYPSGRVSDFAFHPTRKNVIYVAFASGGLWKTTNNGTTWTPLFDTQSSYALGVVEMDPSDPMTLWVGSGENNAQRSVAAGDGVYKTTDGGATWTNVGLKDSAHISQIWINPENGDHVRVAAQGPLWNEGGDRGLFETKDGGKSWETLLSIDHHTGVNEFVVNPANPDEIVASSYQRRRHVWTLINGGPSSGIHRSTDGGASWSRISAGLPRDHMGRIGLAMAPSAPNMIYAIIEGQDHEKGTYRSTNFGQSWSKRSGHMTTSAQYYNELVVDPHDAERVYSLDTFTSVSEDGGKTFTRLTFETRHVDDHALWVDPDDSMHIFIGGDGGLYESWDRGQTWRHMQNLPLVQFYRASPDNDFPFYNVCGGTQDNNSLCGPSRTTYKHGIANADWHIILGGDGYKAVSDPTDPNIVYTQYQYGGLARYDRRTQERLYIAPIAPSGENAYKFNWNTPIIISPHKSTRLYYAAEKLFRSDDRGDSWTVVSPDMTRQIDRNQLDVMGRIWSVDTIAKNNSTSIYGAIIGLSESSLKEGLIYVGTDDGVIGVTEDGGTNWTRTEKFRGVPDMSLVEDVIASVHDENVAYAVFDNHKRGDDKPYVMKTTDKGKRWTSIAGNLPARGTVHTIAEDHADPDLLFVGTEYGLFFTQDGGDTWHQIKKGLPTIAVRDLEIQRRENDLVIATFGRGIYVLDDFSPLRQAASEVSAAEATLFPVKDNWLYIVGDLWGITGAKGSQGDQFWQTDNPPYGAIFRYYLKDGLTTAAKSRRKAELARAKNGEDNPYPSWETLRAEDTEIAPAIMFTVRNAEGDIVRRLKGASSKGLHHVAWDHRYPVPNRIRLGKPAFSYFGDPVGPLATPGTYSVQMSKRVNGVETPLGAPQSFTVKAMDQSPENTADPAALLAFQQKTADLQRAVDGAVAAVSEMQNRIKHLDVAVDQIPVDNTAYQARLKALKAGLTAANTLLSGDRTIGSRNEPTPISIRSRVITIIFSSWQSRSKPAGQHVQAYEMAKRDFAEVRKTLTSLAADLTALEADLDAAGAPWTPGRLPT